MTTELLNTILILSFVAVILVALLGGLIGYFKGIYKTTLKTIIKAILITILIFLTPSLSNAIGKINVQFIFQTTEPISLQSWLAGILTDSGIVSPVNGISLYSTIIALANSLIAYATFLVGMILIQILASPLTAIFYHGIFRWFLPVESKKDIKEKKKNKEKSAITAGLETDDGQISQNPKKKLPLLRIPGAVLGTIQQFIFVLILITPVTALATITINNKKVVHPILVDTMKVSEEDATTFDSYIDVSEQSLIFRLTHGLGLDSAIMNKASEVKVNNTSVSFDGLVNALVNVAEPVLDSNSISYDSASQQVTVNFSTLLSVNTIDALIDRIIANPVIIALIPPIVDTAMNAASGSTLPLSQLDFSHVDWTNDLTIVKSIYDTIYDSGIKPMLSNEKFTPENFNLPTSTYTDEQIETFNTAFGKLGEMDSIKDNLPVVLSSLGNYFQGRGYSVLPTEESAYENIDWSHDFSIFSNVFFRLLSLLKMDLNPDFNYYTLMDQLSTTLKDRTSRDTMESFIVSSDSVTGLLDMDLFSVLSVPKILSSTLESVPAIAGYVKAIDIDTLLSDYRIDDYKREFSTMFDLLGNIYSENSHIDLEHYENIHVTDSETASQIADLLTIGKKSRIFKEIYPSVMKTFLFSSEYDFSDYLFGLTPYNFNYDATNFIDNLTTLLKMMPQIDSLRNLMNDKTKTNAEKLKAIDPSTIKDLLTLLVESDFFNSEQNLGISSTKQKNINIHTFLENFFTGETFSSINLVVPSLDELQDIQWQDTSTQTGEITNLCNIISDVQKNVDFFLDEKHDLARIEDTFAVSRLIKDGLDSRLVGNSILQIIDSSLGDYFDKMGLHITLNKMRNAIYDDADRIGEIISVIKPMNLDNPDLKDIDTLRLNSLLTHLTQSEIIKASNTYSDPFGYSLYAIFKKFGVYSDLGIVSPEVSLFSLGSDWSLATSTESITDEDGKSESLLVTSDGEIKVLTDFLATLQKYSLDEIKNGNIPDGFVDDIKSSLSSKIIRSICSKILSFSVSSLSLPSSFEEMKDSIDFDLFASMSKEDASKELDFFDHLYHLSRDSYTPEGTSEATTKLNYMMDHLYSLGDLEEELDTLLDEFSSSKLMTSKKEGCLLSPLGYLYKGIINNAGLKNRVTMDDSSNVDATLEGILSQVKDDVEETNSLKTILNQLQGLDSDFSISSLTLGQAKTLLDTLNSSDIFHRLPISLIKSALEENNISDYLKDPTTGTIVHPMRYNVHLSTGKEDKEYWKNDIDNLLEMMLGDNGLSSVFRNSGTDFSSIDLSDSSIKLDFLYYLGSIHLFEKNRSYLLYNLINQSAQGNDISVLFDLSGSTPYGENKAVYRFETLYFRNPKLLDSNNVLDKDKAIHDASMLKNALVMLLKQVGTISTGSDINDVTISFEALNLTATDLSNADGSMYRSDLTSEIIAGLEKELVHNDNFKITVSSVSVPIFAPLKNENIYASDYVLVNPIEGRGIDGLIELAKVGKNLTSTTPYFTKDQLTPIFSEFGSKTYAPLDETESQILACFRSLDQYKTTSNSHFINLVNDNLGELPVCLVDALVPSQLKDLTGAPLSTYFTNSYEEIMETISSLIK